MSNAREPGVAKRVWGLLTGRERRRMVLIMGLTFIGVLLEMFGIGLVIPTILLMTQENLGAAHPELQPVLDFLGNPDQQTLIVAGMLTLVGVYVVKSIYLLFLTWFRTRFFFSVRVRVSRDLFTKYVRQPYVFHLQRNSSKLIRNILTEVHQATVGTMMPGVGLFTDGAVLLGLSILLLIVEPMGTLAVAVVLGSAAWAFQRFTKNHLTRWSEQRIHHEGLRLQYIQQGLDGVKDIKLLGREGDLVDRYMTHTRNGAKMGQNQQVLNQMPRLWLELLAVSGMALLVVTMVARSSGAISTVVPTLALFAAAAFRMLPSVNKVLGAVQTLRFMTPVIINVSNDLALPAQPPVRKNGTAQGIQNSIELDGITFSYPETTEPALRDVTLKIDRGTSVGFVGTSGSGKSTLIDVVLGMLLPSSGKVLVDGVDIYEDIRNWQEQIGYVPQTIYLTDDTLRRNVAFGLTEDEIDDAAVERAIRSAQLDEFIDGLPEGLETMVGERGVKLSGGQRQRIGIARALYHDPEVLVLDEATSSLDTQTEKAVMDAVNAMHGTKTILIVAHRLSTIEGCDRVFRLEKGDLVEDKPPATLMINPEKQTSREAV